MSHYKDVKKFHKKFGQLRPIKPRHLTQRKLRERIEFLQEELDEFKDSCEARDIAGQADALVDIVYVAIGTAIMMGLPWKELWKDVQRANMAKERGMTHRGHAMDCRKPAGWVPPKTMEILVDAGYTVGTMTELDDPCHLDASKFAKEGSKPGDTLTRLMKEREAAYDEDDCQQLQQELELCIQDS